MKPKLVPKRTPCTKIKKRYTSLTDSADKEYKSKVIINKDNMKVKKKQNKWNI